MEAWELREQYLKSGMNEAEGNAKGKSQNAKREGVFLSAREYLESVADQAPWAEVKVDAEEEKLLAELEKEEEAEERSEVGGQRSKGNIEQPTSNIEQPTGAKSGQVGNLRVLSPHGLTSCDLTTCESSADVAARMPASPAVPRETFPPYSLWDALAEAWDRIAPRILADPDERAARLARRRMPVLMRPPRPWCLCIRASDSRINSFTARCAPSDAAYPRSHLGPGVKFVPQEHDVTIDKPLMRKLCAPVHITWGLEVEEMADRLGMSREMVRRFIRRKLIGVRYHKLLGGKKGKPKPVSEAVPWPLDPSACSIEPPDPLWAHNWPLLCAHVPEEFEQMLTRVPAFSHFRLEARPGSALRFAPPTGQFLGWKWVCPGCKRTCRRVYYPVSPDELVALKITGLERDEIDELPKYPGTFACWRCHKVSFHTRTPQNSWNSYVSWMSGGWLYGHEVQRPPDYHLAPDRPMLVRMAINPNAMQPRRPARKLRPYKPRPRKSPRRHQVIRLFLRGLATWQIALELRMKQDAVNGHLWALRLKHGLKRRKDLFALLRRKFPEMAKDGPEAYSPMRKPLRPHKRRPRPATQRLHIERLLALGWDIPRIADELGITRTRVKRQLYHACRHHGAKSKQQLLAKLRTEARDP